jgi:hypothetical protein
MWYTNRYLTFIMAKYMYFYFKLLFNGIKVCVYGNILLFLENLRFFVVVYFSNIPWKASFDNDS